jgi:hypothetical protein
MIKDGGAIFAINLWINYDKWRNGEARHFRHNGENRKNFLTCGDDIPQEIDC